MQAVLAVIVALASVAQAADEVAVTEAIRAFNTHAHFPIPVPEKRDLQKLLEHKVIRLREIPSSNAEPQRIIGLLVVEQPRNQLWLAQRDPHLGYDMEEMTDVVLPPGKSGRERWYQHYDIPRPFADRHWIIDVWDNHVLAEKSNGVAWEHPWSLAPNAEALIAELGAQGKLGDISPQVLAKSIYTPWNDGGWLNIAVDADTTIIGFQAATIIGGAVPDRLIAEYSAMQMGKLLEGLASRSVGIYEHYDAGHEPLLGGDGKPIPKQGK